MNLRLLTADEQVKFKAKRPDVDPSSVVIDEDTRELYPYTDELAKQVPIADTGNVIRQIAFRAPAQVGGRVLGGLAGGTIAGLSTAGTGAIPGAIAGGVAGAMGTQYLQDKAIDLSTKIIPGNFFARQKAKFELENRANPYTSALLGLASTPAGGGGNIVKAFQAGPRDMVKQGMVQAGLDLPIQLATTGTWDPGMTAVSGIGGAGLAHGIGPQRNFERRLLNKTSLPTSAIDAIAPKIMPPDDAVTQLLSKSAAANNPLPAGFDITTAPHLSAAAHRKIGDPLNLVLAELKDVGIATPAELINRIAPEVASGYGERVVRQIKNENAEVLHQRELQEAQEAELKKSEAEAVKLAKQDDVELARLTKEAADRVKLAETVKAEEAGQEAKAAEVQRAEAEALLASGVKNQQLEMATEKAAADAEALAAREAAANPRAKAEAAQMKILEAEAARKAISERAADLDENSVEYIRAQLDEADQAAIIKQQQEILEAEGYKNLKKLRREEAEPEAPLPPENLPVVPPVTPPVAAPQAPVAPKPTVIPGKPRILRAGQPQTTSAIPAPGLIEALQPKKPGPSVVVNKPAVVEEVKPVVEPPAEPVTPPTKPVVSDPPLIATPLDRYPAGTKLVIERPDHTRQTFIVDRYTDAGKIVGRAITSNTTEIFDPSAVVGRITPAITKEASKAAVVKLLDAATETSSNLGEPGAPVGKKGGRKFPGTTSAIEKPAVKKKVEAKGMQIKPNLRRKGQEGSIINPAEILGKVMAGATDLASKPLYKLTEPVYARIRRSGVHGPFVEKKFKELETVTAQLEGLPRNAANQLRANTTAADREIIDTFLTQRSEGLTPSVTLTPDQLKIAEQVQKVWDHIGQVQAQPDSPDITEYDASGKPHYRRVRILPNHIGQQVKTEIMKALHEGTPEQKRQIEDIWMRYLISQGLTPEAAKSAFNARALYRPFTEGAPNPEFQALRQSHGVGIPPEFRMNTFDALPKVIHRMAKDIAFHRVFERDPKAMRLLGYEKDLSGKDVPEVLDEATGQSLRGDFKGDPNVMASMKEHVHTVRPESISFDSWQRLVSSAKLQIKSNVRDILTMGGTFMEVMKLPELRFVAPALKDMLTPSYRNKALAAGAMRAENNFMPITGQDAVGVINDLATLMSKAGLGETLNVAQRKFSFSLGKAVAKGRIAAKDGEFLEKWGPTDWKKRLAEDPEGLADYLGTQLTLNTVGSYGPRGLPPELLSSAAAGWKVPFGLSRYNIERFNNWEKNVHEPLRKGDFGPLLRSTLGAFLGVAGVQYMAEIFDKQKPREMTVEEYLKLGDNKQAAYTLFSKLDIAGYAGSLSQMMLAGTQALEGELPRAVQNLFLATAEDNIARVVQFAKDIKEGRATFAEDYPTMLFTLARDNIQNLKMLDPKPDDRGMREERLSARAGYTKSKDFYRTTIGASPFSESASYQSGDVNRLAKVFTQKRAEGETPSMPNSAIRTAINTKDGQMLIGPGGSGSYYEFIRKTQGEAAALEALARDQKRQGRNQSTYIQALTK